MPALLEQLFAVLMMIYLSSSITGFWAGDSSSNAWRLEDNPLLLVIQTGMYTVTFGFVVLHWRKFVGALWASGWVLALALLAVLSSLWSSDPSFTLRRGLVLFATTLFGIYFGSRYELARQVRLVGWTFVILASLSVACVLWLPHYGLDQELHRGDWQGILGHKNLLGKAMVVAIILCSTEDVLPWGVRVSALPMCAVALFMSGSRAALLMSIALLLILPAYRLLRTPVTTRVPLGLLMLLAVASLGWLAIDKAPLLLAIVGRNATLTRRTEVWTAVWAAISRHMLLGYGFSGFWAGLHGESTRIAARLGFVARHAHNGFLDLWLELGITGLVLFAAGYLQAARNGIRLQRMSRDRVAFWPLQYLAFMFLYNLAEGPILRQNNLYWALYVAVIVATATAVRMAKTSHAASLIYGPILPDGSIEQHRDHLPRRPAGVIGNVHPRAGRGVA